MACGLVTTAALSHGFTRSGRRTLGAANRVTLTRATLVGGVTALVADALVGPANIPAIVGLAVVALDPRRGGRLGRPAHPNGVGAGRTLRHGGRRVLDLGPERVRRGIGRAVGARHRRGAVRLLGGRPAGAMAGPAVAAAVLAQTRRRDPGHRAHGRGGRPDPGHRHSRGGRRGDGRSSPSPSAAMWSGSGASTRWREPRPPSCPSLPCEGVATVALPTTPELETLDVAADGAGYAPQSPGRSPRWPSCSSGSR